MEKISVLDKIKKQARKRTPKAVSPEKFYFAEREPSDSNGGKRMVVEVFKAKNGHKYMSVRKEYTKRNAPTDWLFGKGVSVDMKEEDVRNLIAGLTVVAKSQNIVIDLEVLQDELKVNGMV